MVLNKKEVESKFNDIKESYYNYMVLNTSHLPYEKDSSTFRCAIEVLNLINTIKWANEVYQNVNSKDKIEFKILYRVIEAVMMGKPFSDKELTEYYNLLRKIEVFYRAVQMFIELEVYCPYEVDFILLGLKIEKYNDLNEKSKESLNEKYCEILWESQSDKKTVEDLIIKAKKIVQQTIEKTKGSLQE